MLCNELHFILLNVEENPCSKNSDDRKVFYYFLLFLFVIFTAGASALVMLWVAFGKSSLLLVMKDLRSNLVED